MTEIQFTVGYVMEYRSLFESLWIWILTLANHIMPLKHIANKIYPAISFFLFSQKTVGKMC